MELQIKPGPSNVGPSPAPSPDHWPRRSTHLVLAVTRYASLEPSSLSAAIRDGLNELLQGHTAPTAADPVKAYVYFRNRQGSTVTLEIAIPVGTQLADAAINGSMRRHQNVPRLVLETSPGGGLAEAMDRAVKTLKLSSRSELPDCWQVLELPFTGYDPSLPLSVGFPRNQNGQH